MTYADKTADFPDTGKTEKDLLDGRFSWIEIISYSPGPKADGLSPYKLHALYMLDPAFTIREVVNSDPTNSIDSLLKERPELWPQIQEVPGCWVGGWSSLFVPSDGGAGAASHARAPEALPTRKYGATGSRPPGAL